MVTCIYSCKLWDESCLIIITGSKSLVGQCLSIEINDWINQYVYKFDINSWLFTKRKGSKSFEINSIQVDTYWDLSLAKFEYGLEPLEGFYLAMVFNGEMVLMERWFYFLGIWEKKHSKRLMPPLVFTMSYSLLRRNTFFERSCIKLRLNFETMTIIIIYQLSVIQSVHTTPSSPST